MPKVEPESNLDLLKILLGLSTKNSDLANDGFQGLLAQAGKRVENATGLTREDAKYGAAESVQRADVNGYVYVTYQGKRYGPVYETWGPLDGSKDKMTALINAQGEDGTDHWIKLEYLGKSVLPAEPKTQAQQPDIDFKAIYSKPSNQKKRK